MTGTPPSTPHDSGETPPEEGGERHSTPPARHQNPEPPAHSASGEPTPGHGRHEMPGPRGYPQFEGPGAAQYGSEPVEPPPPLPPRQATPSGSGAQPPAGYGPPPQSGAPQQYSSMPQQPGSVPPGQFSPGQPYSQGPGQMGAVPPGADPSGPPSEAGAQQGAPQREVPDTLDVGHAISYGWDRFRLNPIPWVGIVLVGLIAYLVVVVLVNIADVQSLPVVLLVFGITSLMVWLLQAAMIRGALYETDGTPTDFPSFFGFVNAGSVLLTALIVFLACLITSVLCVIPAIIIGVLCMYALNFVIDQDMNPIEALKSSARLVIANAFQSALLALTVTVMTLLGLLLCGIGLLVTGPVSAIAVTYAYRTLTGRLVAPL